MLLPGVNGVYRSTGLTHMNTASRRHGNSEQWLDRAGLARVQAAKLRSLLNAVIPANPFWSRRFLECGVDAATVDSVIDLAPLAPLTKPEISADHAAHPPYGSNLTYPLERFVRMHQTSGTTGRGMRWLDTAESWNWIMSCWELIYDAIRLEPSDRLFFAFSFGPFIGFWAAFEGALRRGNFCLSGGGMSSAARVRAIVENQMTAICCTPTYALRLAEVARQEGIDIAGSPVRILLLAGEPGANVAGTRERIAGAFNARVFDHTGMTEIGSLGIECAEAPRHVHLLESECIAELVDPGTGELLFAPGDGDVLLPEPREGELVLTNLGRTGSPLIRYRTGDIVRLQTGRCACGRDYLRMVGGILGRADEMIFVRGNNVYPSAVDSIVREFPEIVEYQLLVGESAGLTVVTLRLEPDSAMRASEHTRLAARISAAVHERLFFNVDIEVVAPGTLPRFELKASRLVRLPRDAEARCSERKPA